MKTYDDCVIFLLAKAYQKAHGEFKRRLHSYGLTPIQHLILEALWEEDGLSAGDIGKKLIFDGATLSGVGPKPGLQTCAEPGRFVVNFIDPRAHEARELMVVRGGGGVRPVAFARGSTAHEVN